MRIGIDFDNTIVNTKETVRKFMDKYNIEEFKNEEEKTLFYREHIDDITKNLTLKENVVDVLNRLKQNNELFIITDRSNYYSNNLKSLTLEFIKENNIPINNVYFNTGLKFEKCLELNIDVFIDDLVINCQSVNKTGIKVLIFENDCEGIRRVNNWLEIEEVIAKWKKEL